MSDDKHRFSWAVQAVLDVGQLGLSVVLPIVLLALLGNYLTQKFSLSGYVTLIFIVIGFAAGINGFVRFAKSWIRRSEKDEKSKKQ